VFAALLAVAFLVTPEASAQSPQHHMAPHEKPTIDQKVNHAANIAVAHIGDPYRYGAAGPQAFDCSGLAMWSYDHANLHLPRTAAEQYAAVRHLVKAHLQRGDLVFFHDRYGHVYHVGIFLYWNAQHRAVIVHAPYPGQRVHREAVWTSSWYAGTRRP
jgi:cell wall-associated NlpC family hydrolase